MRSFVVKNTLFIILLISTAMQIQAEPLTVISYGGLHVKAQGEAFYKPFEEQTKIKLLTGEYNGEMAKIRSMVDTKNVSWDVVQVETGDLYRGCSEGLFEQIDWSTLKIDEESDYVDGSLSDCGAGFFIWSIVLAYDTHQFKTPPKDWKDFWDIKKFPGKRALRKSPILALEAALLADGVKPADIYTVLATPEGVDRAFKKLDEIKPYIQWWESGSQPMQWLISGNVVMTSAYNGRVYDAQEEGKPVGIVWNDSFYDMDSFAIVKGTKNKEAAERFITLTMQPENQKIYSEVAGYGFSNKKTAALLDKNTLEHLSTAPEHMENAHKLDPDFWIDHGETLQQRFNIWISE